MFMSKKFLVACILSTTSLSVWGGQAFAEEGSRGESLKNYVLDEYVVTATKTENKIFDANANISVITKADIERMHYESLEDVLRTVTNVQFLNYGMPGYNQSKVRINGSDNILVLMDGVRVSNSATGLQYPFSLVDNMDNIERIEILKGSSAVLYGSDAKGGVINIITKKHTTPKTKISASSGNFGKEEYKISTEGKLGDTSYRIYGQKHLSGNYEDGAGIEWKAHDNAENTGIMLRHEFEPGSNITLNYTHGNDEFAFLDHLYNQNINGYAKSKNLQLVYNQKISDTLTNTLSYNNSRYEHVGILNDPNWGASNFWNNHYKSRVINDTLIKTFGDTHTVILGIEHFKAENLNPSKNWTTREEYYQSMENTSYFLQDEWNFDQRWKLTSGIRYDSPSGGLVEIDSNISKSFNLGYKFNPETNIYVAYNDYFILPSMYQLYDTKYGNAKLLPEKGKNYELGFNHMLDDKTMLNIHYFNRNSKQNIGFSTESNTYINDNEKAHGFDVQIDKQFDDTWNASIGYSRLSYANKRGTTNYGYLPKNLVTLGVTYTKDKWDIGIDGKGFLCRDGNNIESHGWPSDKYWVFNVSANYKMNKNLKLFAKCNNIFNQEYAEQTNAIWGGKPGDWYGMPGRNFILGAELTF